MKARMSLFLAAVLGLLALCGPAMAEWSEPLMVPEVNTEWEEHMPFLSYDGLTLYFARMDTDTFYYARIYQATRPEPYGAFTSVEEISELNYSGGHVSSPWVSPDNLRMYYYRTEPGSYKRIKVSERASADQPWPQGVNISELNALGNVKIPRLTADELTIVFQSDNIPGGQGGIDIYIATRLDKYSPFENVRNLTEINSAGYEGSPFVSPDGLALYFNAEHNGMVRIYRGTRQSLVEPFSNIEMIPLLDTPDRAAGAPAISSDGTALYFNSRDPQTNNLDIWVSYLVRQQVAIDIKPGSCPNPLNLASRGVLPVAILGTEDFDVSTIDPASIFLEGVPAMRSSYEDVATPVVDGNECECNTEGPDGYVDLTLKFKTQQIVEQLANSLGELGGDEELVLILAGALSDGTPIEGTDCVVIVGKIPRPLAAKKSDINGDGIVNILDFAMIAKYWLEIAAVQY